MTIVPMSEPTLPSPCGAIAPSANTIGTSARSSNSSIASAERPTGLCVPTKGITIAVEDSASARPSATEPDALCPMAKTPPPIISAQPASSAAPTPNTSRRIESKRRNDSSSPTENSSRTIPSSAKGSMPLGVRNGHVIERRIMPGERAEAEGADDHSNDDEADDRRDLQAGEGRDDDPGGAEDDQRVTEARCRIRPPLGSCLSPCDGETSVAVGRVTGTYPPPCSFAAWFPPHKLASRS